VPPPPIVTTIVAPGVVEIVEVPETIPLETEADPVTKTSPAPPPPPSSPNPPPPPPPTTIASIAVTPAGTLQLHVVELVKVRTVYPAGGDGLVTGEQAANVGVPVVEDVAVPLPTEFTARI
jgi:hypothetical protein